MSTTADQDSSSAPASGPPAGDAAAWIEQLQGAVEAASAEARSAFFYYAGFGLYFAIAVAGTSHEDLLRGATVTMPGLGIGMPVVGFYVVVPALFMVFHVYVLLQLVVLARRIGWLKLALKHRPGSATLRQRLLVSPFAISQRLLGEPQGVLPQFLLRLSIWLTLVLIPLGLLLATQLRFLPYHAAGVTWAHRLYIVIDALLLLLLWPAIVHPERRGTLGWLTAVARRTAWRGAGLAAGVRSGAEALRRRTGRWRRLQAAGGPRRAVGALGRLGLVLAVLFAAFVIATVPGETLENELLSAREPIDPVQCASLSRVGSWLLPVRLPDRRRVLCVTYATFEAPEAPFGLRRNIVANATSFVVDEPPPGLVDELDLRRAWQLKGRRIDLQGRDLRFADLSESDLSGADLRGANLQGAMLRGAKLSAALAGPIPEADIGHCAHRSGEEGSECVTGLRDADLTTADLRFLDGYKIDLQGANLTGASLEDARLQHGQLDGALLTWAHLDRVWLHDASLTGAVLREVTAPKVQLIKADLDYAFLRKANLAEADLTDVELYAADVREIQVGEKPSQPRALMYELPPPAVPDAELTLTADLFARACPEGVTADEPEAAVWAARGVIHRLWHEFEYSQSHDPEGYARIANLRYLLAKLMLDRETCPHIDLMPGRDVCRLHRFEAEWEGWRGRRAEGEEKPLGPDLESRWDDLRRLIAALPEVGATGDRTLTDTWQRLDLELGDRARQDEVCL
jgi:uncharacterized protein YjbI with pentapeptide repeats